ncbi:MAG: hypothetical protein CVT96_02130 [Bacteroidetes bacterium HGW-Bacteroidetes-13]|nr:MAG: hypothetical protein CVT96_02130 [Bacteroidetes bacterium HGW-Bacteroidetes-13]
MKLKKLLLIGLMFSISTLLQAQTDGTLTFTFNQPPPGGSNNNVLAVWIENSTGTFIKTKMRFVGGGTSDHLPVFAVKAGGTISNALSTSVNVTDATTGATRKSATVPTAWGFKTVVWDGKNVAGSVNGTTVPDGDYTVFVESSWVDGDPNMHDELIGFTFTKGPNPQTITPTGDIFINTVTLDWAPVSLGLDDNVLAKQKILVYPNPSNGVFNIDFKNTSANNIEVVNILGQIVYFENYITTNVESLKVLDLSSNANGIYILKVTNENGASSHKLVIEK